MTRNDWTASEMDLLLRLKAEGKRWRFIGEALPRHSLSSCEVKYHALTRPAKSRAVAKPPPAAPRPFSAQQATGGAPTGRVISTARMVVDAELRDRIGAQGVTAGLLGDPMPGRSMLDKRLAGRPEPAAPPTQGMRSPPKVTLARGGL